MRYLLLALLTAFSLSVFAGKPTKEQRTPDQSLQSADACDLSIDQPGGKRQQQSAEKQKECRTFNESRSNNSRGAGKDEGTTVQKAGAAGIAASKPGAPSDKATGATK